MNYSSTQEKWKKIVQLQNRYEISNQGRIRNATRGGLNTETI